MKTWTYSWFLITCTAGVSAATGTCAWAAEAGDASNKPNNAVLAPVTVTTPARTGATGRNGPPVAAAQTLGDGVGATGLGVQSSVTTPASIFDDTPTYSTSGQADGSNAPRSSWPQPQAQQPGMQAESNDMVPATNDPTLGLPDGNGPQLMTPSFSK